MDKGADDAAEDEVQYLVKWRGLPHKCTKSWGTIKHDAWEHMEHFWKRERSPPSRKSEKRKMPPELKFYKKLDVSPVFGVVEGGGDDCAGRQKG